jgi:glutamate/tyrosine decarboxylase-like PLP-dependent enzyme
LSSNPQKNIRNFISKEQIKKFQDLYDQLDKEGLTLKGHGIDHRTWFLGPKGENEELFRSLITSAIDSQIEFRKNFHPEDPEFLTEEERNKPIYVNAVKELKQQAYKFFTELQQSAPAFSYRYIGHMVWDINLPSIIGYFASMLYNQNNVAAEASPVTTVLEIEVGKDLCKMLGYKKYTFHNNNNSYIEIEPWGHITCDGTVANIEGLWASRNLKFFPLSLKEAILKEEILSNVRSLEVQLLDNTVKKLTDLDVWTLLNLKADDVLSLPKVIQDKFGITTDTITQVLQKYSIQNIGFIDFYNLHLKQEIQYSPVVMAPITQHYSWPKSAAILGIGSNNMLGISVDVEGHMDLDDLKAKLQKCLDNKQPVITVVAVIGTTEESAVDPLEDILKIREEFRQKGLDFTIHADAAWGGYFASMLHGDDDLEFNPQPSSNNTYSFRGNNFFSISDYISNFIPEYPLSEYVLKQYYSLRLADSITVDPHKAGYIPYPAGGLCYRNSAMREIVSFKAPVVHHDEWEPTVGIYGIEGSKPGAAAAATYFSHKIIRPNKSGYGRIHGQCIFTSKKLYSRLVSMEDERFILVAFHRLPTEKRGESKDKVQDQIKFIRERIVKATNEEIEKDGDAMNLLRELGSDQTITPYVFNFKQRNGELNTDVKKMNELNKRLFNTLSMVPKEIATEQNLLVTSSQFDPDVYGNKFMNSLTERLGIENQNNEPITFIISTVMNPWLTDLPIFKQDGQSRKSFLDVIEEELRKAVYTVMRDMNLL